MSLLFRLKNRPSSDSELDQNDTIHSQKFREWNFKLAKHFVAAQEIHLRWDSNPQPLN